MIPVNTPILGEQEKINLMQCIESGWISSEGPLVAEFEQQFASKVGRKYGVAVMNGTAALYVAVRALKLPPGSEVILPTFCIISCLQAVIENQLVPVLVDCDEHTWNMDCNVIEHKISKKTKAIMVVHTYGLPVDMEPLIQLANQYHLKIIEDAAEVIGQTYKSKTCGSFGDISIVSFYPNKHITTGEGGMVLTDSKALAEQAKKLRNLAFEKDKRFYHTELGWNFRMTNVQAAIGLAQLERLDDNIAKKREIGIRYAEAFKDIPYIQIPLAETTSAQNIYWVFGIVLAKPLMRHHIIQQLEELGIGTRPFFWCMHEQPILQKMGYFKEEKHPVSENLARQGFYLPSGLGLSEEEQNYVIKSFKNIMEHRYPC
ncbi:MAG TPA: DegT/DnrJ/EryC1/StrS aminotransferase family protein [Gammaproteobacteria bacterium]|nr:DegT/DnrJ/EryC1/StrS aminotransferase family protein [Gammaproteobacteria bacterium]